MQGSAAKPNAPQGERLRVLRKSLKISHEMLVEQSRDAAQCLGEGYEPILRSNLSAIENGRLRLSKDATRAVFCAIFAITRDEFANYLDGKIALQRLLHSRDRRLARRASSVHVTS